MNKGFIQLHRSLLGWEWYDDHNTKILFLHCLLKANYKDKNYRGKNIVRGSFITGFEVLSNEVGLSVQKTRTALTKLKSTNEITIKSTSQGTVIQVVKYNEYQQSTSEITNEQQTNNKQITTTNNSNNIKKSKETSKHDKNIKEILEHLNNKLGSKFRVANGLKARLNEGFTVEDAKKVIDIKFAEWIGDEKMKQYIRPDTLFGNKFDSYLNQEMQAQQEKPFSPVDFL
jgi:uncharacterized phage protein (TIGR02220 family)